MAKSSYSGTKSGRTLSNKSSGGDSGSYSKTASGREYRNYANPLNSKSSLTTYLSKIGKGLDKILNYDLCPFGEKVTDGLASKIDSFVYGARLSGKLVEEYIRLCPRCGREISRCICKI